MHPASKISKHDQQRFNKEEIKSTCGMRIKPYFSQNGLHIHMNQLQTAIAITNKGQVQTQDVSS